MGGVNRVGLAIRYPRGEFETLEGARYRKYDELLFGSGLLGAGSKQS